MGEGVGIAGKGGGGEGWGCGGGGGSEDEKGTVNDSPLFKEPAVCDTHRVIHSTRPPTTATGACSDNVVVSHTSSNLLITMDFCSSFITVQ